MTLQIRHIHNDRGRNRNKVAHRDLIDDILHSDNELSPFRLMNDHMQGELDIEDVRNDPDFPAAEVMTHEIVSDFNKKKKRNKSDVKFIKENLSGDIRENETPDEISNIKAEIRDNNLNEITEGWIKAWKEETVRGKIKDHYYQEIREYITDSLDDNKTDKATGMAAWCKKIFRSSYISYISISAAAAIGAFILIKALIPSYSPDKLFNTYYAPMGVVLPETRNTDDGSSESFNTGISNYKLGNYQAAAVDFSNVLKKDGSAPGTRFFMGLTQMALGDFNSAIPLLSDVTTHAGEFSKDAEWYLGLAYLKTGDKEKATGCFDLLAKVPGFYNERAETILRHLK